MLCLNGGVGLKSFFRLSRTNEPIVFAEFVTVLAFSAAYVRTLSVLSDVSVRMGIVRKAYYLTDAHLRQGPR